MRRALVTGATGLVGSYIVERLCADDWTVRALVRDPAAAAWLAHRGVELVRGDILAPDRLLAAARGCDVVFHCAALVVSSDGAEQYRRHNVDGTRHVIDAAAAAGARLLQLSSVAVYGAAGRYRDRPTDEDTPLPPVTQGAPYGRTKRESEQMALQAHAEGRVWATAVRPDVIYGVRDRHFVPRVARILMSGLFPVVAGGRSTLAIVHAANVADGAIRAVTSDVAGGRAYNLANDYDVTVADFARLAAEGLERRVRVVSIPRGVARAGIAGALGIVRLVRGRSMVQQASGTLDFVTRDNPFTSERARRELGWQPPVTPDVGIPEAFRWWKTHRS